MVVRGWGEGVDEEISFWRDWISTKGSSWPEDYTFRVNPNSQIQFGNLVDEFINPRILDVGAGPMTCLGKIHNGKRVNIIAIDALAHLYNDLPFEKGTPLLKTIQCKTENILENFEPESFEICHARNTLDHSEDPLACLKQMIDVTKINGYILTRHHANEGAKANWHGMHQWNFNIDKNSLNISNSSGESVSVTDALGDKVQVVKISAPGADFCIFDMKRCR
jgi:SAM-dependent methyltransferase